MKNIVKKLFLIYLLLAVLTACDSDFGQFNTDPTTVATVDLASLFSSTQVKAATLNPELMTSYGHAYMQYGWSDFWFGINYERNDGTSNRLWNHYYPNVIKDLEYVIPRLSNDPTLSNTLAAAKVWRVFIYQKLTDHYGDIPYSQAGKTILDGTTVTPVYDSQQSIYADFITQLRSARDAFDPTVKTVVGDQFYGGDPLKWRKLANSLLLRVGMRLIKIDPTQAKALVAEAVNSSHGGVMTSNDDVPILKYDKNTNNGFNFNLNDQHFTLHATLVDHMVITGDPRLFIYGRVYKNQKSIQDSSIVLNATAADFAAHDWDPSITDQNYTNNSKGLRTRARFDIFSDPSLPFIHFPYAQVEFLLAEAVLRGYIQGDASSHFEKGITAHMQSFSDLKKGVAVTPEISASSISTYLANNPLIGTTEEMIEQVNEEFWVSGFIFQADEVWANWRRTGYPVLTPTPAGHTPGAGGAPSTAIISRKMPYPQDENNTNSANLTAALSNYGGVNDFNSKARVWWDKP